VYSFNKQKGRAVVFHKRDETALMECPREDDDYVDYVERETPTGMERRSSPISLSGQTLQASLPSTRVGELDGLFLYVC
jgi:hypothetical protein